MRLLPILLLLALQPTNPASRTAPVQGMARVSPLDSDGDGVPDARDACLGHPDQADADGDHQPDGCDPCPGTGPTPEDGDGDGICDAVDSCPDEPGTDPDGDGDCADDRCPGHPDDLDADGDGTPDGCDPCLGDQAMGDRDSDGVCDGTDRCPLDALDDCRVCVNGWSPHDPGDPDDDWMPGTPLPLVVDQTLHLRERRVSVDDSDFLSAWVDAGCRLALDFAPRGWADWQVNGQPTGPSWSTGSYVTSATVVTVEAYSTGLGCGAYDLRAFLACGGCGPDDREPDDRPEDAPASIFGWGNHAAVHGTLPPGDVDAFRLSTAGDDDPYCSRENQFTTVQFHGQGEWRAGYMSSTGAMIVLATSGTSSDPSVATLRVGGRVFVENIGTTCLDYDLESTFDLVCF